MRIVLELPITDKRPEEIRVVQVGAWFMIESRRPGKASWITLAEKTNEAEAKREAENWY